MAAIAHSANAQGVRHELAAHLRGVAERAATFARGLHAEQLGWYLGLWHDLGKFHPAFQAYLRACEEPTAPRRGPDHKAAGATLALRHRLGLPALVLQGHHGGLLTPQLLQEWVNGRSPAGDVGESLALARAALGACPFIDQKG